LLQGLPGDFDLPGFTVAAKYRAVGNGVHVDVAKFIAHAIRNPVAAATRLCACGCARPLKGKEKSAGIACRKRLQRRREQSVTRRRTKAAGGSQLTDKAERWFMKKGLNSTRLNPI
jgi:hypothetical protein